MAVDRAQHVPPGVKLRIERPGSIETFTKVLIENPADRGEQNETDVGENQVENRRLTINSLTIQIDQTRDAAENHQRKMNLEDQNERFQIVNVSPEESVGDAQQHREIDQRAFFSSFFVHVEENEPPDDHRIDHRQFIGHLSDVRQRAVKIRRAESNEAERNVHQQKSTFESVENRSHEENEGEDAHHQTRQTIPKFSEIKIHRIIPFAPVDRTGARRPEALRWIQNRLEVFHQGRIRMARSVMNEVEQHERRVYAYVSVVKKRRLKRFFFFLPSSRGCPRLSRRRRH